MKRTFAYIQTSQAIKSLFFLFLLLCITGIASQAQPPDIGGDVDATVPLDGGLSLLVAAGIAYGARKLRKTGGRNSNREIR